VTVAERAAPTFPELFDIIVANISRAIQGKTDAIELTLICMLSEGHLLIEDVPGVGKTSLAKAIANSIDCTWRRVQCTPDLLPSDITGVTVWNRAEDTFRFQPGPVFCNVLLADEINRAAPRTQSALLEAMEERQVTADGETHPLPRPFIVIATQNPVEHEGTYGLPDSQLDRFLLRVSLGYPDRTTELEILETHGVVPPEITPVVSRATVLGLIKAASGIHVSPTLRSYLVDIAEASRRHPGLAIGMSPRATLSLLRASRVRAAAAGRSYVIPDDVKALAAPVLAHRLIVSDEAGVRGASRSALIEELLGTVAVPAAR
jgi:MoxR-like ATPase